MGEVGERAGEVGEWAGEVGEGVVEQADGAATCNCQLAGEWRWEQAGEQASGRVGQRVPHLLP